MRCTSLSLYVFVACMTIAGSVHAEVFDEFVVNSENRITGSDHDSHVILHRRADFLIQPIWLVAKTREPNKLSSEVRARLEAMISAATAKEAIQVGWGSSRISPLDAPAIQELVDSVEGNVEAQVALVIKTAISPTDTYGTASRRISDFIRAMPETAEVEVLSVDPRQNARGREYFSSGNGVPAKSETELTVVNPEQYRTQILGMIADDARKTAAVFGPSNEIVVTGIQRPIKSYQAGALDVALYIPYQLEVRAIK